MTNEPTDRGHRRVRRILFVVLAVFAALALAAGGVYLTLYWSGRHSLLDRDNTLSAPESLVDNAEEEGRLITYKGDTYRFNESIVSILFMGVDKTDIHVESSYGTNGQADSLFLATMDTKTGHVKVIPLSRETMTDINLYDANGAFIGTQRRQLCLAYAYAANAEEGCENVCRSVGRLLYGMPIDAYVAIDFDGVKALNNAVGGVTVTVLEDVRYYENKVRYDLKKGETITLDNSSLIPYIQNRGEDAEANNRRMQRQKQFLDEFIRVASTNIKKNFTLLEKYYSAIKPYTANDLSFSEITYLASTYLVGNRPAIEYLPVSGQCQMGEEYVEFIPDDTSLYEAILAAFYVKE